MNHRGMVTKGRFSATAAGGVGTNECLIFGRLPPQEEDGTNSISVIDKGAPRN